MSVAGLSILLSCSYSALGMGYAALVCIAEDECGWAAVFGAVLAVNVIGIALVLTKVAS